MKISWLLDNICLKFVCKVAFGLFISVFRLESLFVRVNSGNVAVISLHRIGDSIFVIPALKIINKYFKQDSLYLITYPDLVDIYKLVFSDTQYVKLKEEDFLFNGRIAKNKTRTILRAIQPELIIDLTGSIRTVSLLFNSNARKIVGLNKEHFSALYDEFICVRETPHLVDRYVDVVKMILGKKKLEIEYKFPTSVQRGNILIHPFAGWEAKKWNLIKFIKLLELLKAKFEVEIVSPQNLIPDDIISEIEKLNIPISFTDSLNDLIEKIKKCSLFISNDSGPLYIAALLGKYTFTIYGPTNPRFSLPFGEQHEYIQKKIRCSPSIDKQYCFTDAGRGDCPSFECMHLLETKAVHDKIISFINHKEIDIKLIFIDGEGA